jgi:hypothetical protein
MFFEIDPIQTKENFYSAHFSLAVALSTSVEACCCFEG